MCVKVEVHTTSIYRKGELILSVYNMCKGGSGGGGLGGLSLPSWLRSETLFLANFTKVYIQQNLMA